MPLSLIALFLAAFAFGTTEFVIAGVLPEVAAGLDVNVPTAGYLVSGYAIGIAIGGPLLTLATARLSRKTLLLGLAVAFTAGQAACALAPDFASMLALRVAVAIAHGAYFGVAMVVAVGLVRKDQRGMAVALILAGLTVSNVIGVPAGAAIGNVWGWRSTFWAMFILGIVATLAIAALVPRKTGAVEPARRADARGARSWPAAGVDLAVIMLMLMIGQMVPYTYITPMLREVTGLDAGNGAVGAAAQRPRLDARRLPGRETVRLATYAGDDRGGRDCRSSCLPCSIWPAPTRSRWCLCSSSGAASTS